MFTTGETKRKEKIAVAVASANRKKNDHVQAKIVSCGCLCKYLFVLPVLSVLILALAIYSRPYAFFPDKEYDSFSSAALVIVSGQTTTPPVDAPSITATSEYELLLLAFSDQNFRSAVPRAAWNGTHYAFGRYKAPPIANLHLLNPIQHFGQEKRFNWYSITSGDWLIGLAFLQFHYNGGFVIHAFNRKTLLSYNKQVELPLAANSLWGPRYVANPACLNGSLGANVAADEDTAHSGGGAPRRGGGGPCDASVHQGCVFFDLLAGNYASACAITRDASPSTGVTGGSHFIRLRVNTTVFFSKLLSPQDKTPRDLPIAFDVVIDAGEEFFNMMYPFGPKRPSIVAKAAGRRVVDYLTWSSSQQRDGSSLPPSSSDGGAAEGATKADKKRKGITLRLGPAVITTAEPAVGAFDITRGLLQRLTVWKWLSFSTGALPHIGLTSYGMHISRGVYDVPSNASAESTMYANGDFFAFYDADDVTFTKENASLPAFRTRWFITGLYMKLTFTPYGHFHGDFHYGVLDGDLFHMWGLLEGKAPLCGKTGCLTTESSDKPYVMISNVPAVLEDHYALW